MWLYVASSPNQLIADDDAKVQKALVTIILSMADDQLVHVSGKAKAEDAWNSLNVVYVQQTAGSLITTTHTMYRTIMHSGESVRAHLNALSICIQLLEQQLVSSCWKSKTNLFWRMIRSSGIIFVCCPSFPPSLNWYPKHLTSFSFPSFYPYNNPVR